MIGFSFLLSCHHKADTEEESVAAEDVQTPVTITHIETGPLEQVIQLNATSTFLQSSFIKASASGYLTSVNLSAGKQVNSGQLAFTMKTKEAQALGNTINALDSSFRFSGVIRIYTTTSGYVQQLNYKVGDYVQDGEQLAVLTDSKSFGFVLNLPYELRRYVSVGQVLSLQLPDSSVLAATVSSMMSTVDSLSQTQSILLKVGSSMFIPQNLIAKVTIHKNISEQALTLPKEAVLTDESQTNFWVMKMIDSMTAVKIPVKKGIETRDRVEIVEPKFQANDNILLTGNYGLQDTAKVKIIPAGQ
jgi:hypothetical protein